jgi:four helix bundle protein
MYQDIRERTFQFGVQILKLASDFPESREGKVLCCQMLRSGTSIGANVEEAVAAYSRAEFAFKMNIALKEARETCYWLRLALASKSCASQE